MMTSFQVRSLESSEFSHLFALDDIVLSKMGAMRMVADRKPGFPCRVSLEDAAIGETVMLLSYEHHASNSPYRSGGPIFVRAMATTAALAPNELPAMLAHRSISIRGYDNDGMMKAAMLSEGSTLKEAIQETFADKQIKYIHLHNAKPGCFNCVVERV